MPRQFVQVSESIYCHLLLSWCKRQITLPPTHPKSWTSSWFSYKITIFVLHLHIWLEVADSNRYQDWYQMILRHFSGNPVVIGSATVEQWSIVIGWVLWSELRLLQLKVLPLPLWRWRVKVSMGGGGWEGLCRILQTFPPIRGQTFNFSTL